VSNKTLAQIKQAKQQLQAAILDLVVNFERVNGVPVDYISVLHEDYVDHETIPLETPRVVVELDYEAGDDA